MDRSTVRALAEMVASEFRLYWLGIEGPIPVDSKDESGVKYVKRNALAGPSS